MHFEKTIPQYGDTREKGKFLLMPLKINTLREDGTVALSSTRWFEDACWEERYTKGKEGNFWRRTRWLD